MKLRSLYFKLLVSFGAMLLLTLGLIIFWYEYTLDEAITVEETADIVRDTRLVREAIALAVASDPGAPVAGNKALREYLATMAKVYGARVWLEDERGNVLFASDEGLPVRLDFVPYLAVDDIELSENQDDGLQQYRLTFPVDLGAGRVGVLNGVFAEPIELARAFNTFLVGLAGIAVVVGLFVIPVSRLISSPLRRLEHTVRQYAQGDLAVRAQDGRRDEIGQLAGTFNVMADRLERLVHGSRELVANVSHELRSPLARISMSEELARKNMAEGALEGAERHLDLIDTEVKELDALIGRILQLSRFDLREPEASRPFDLSELARREARRLGPAFEEAGLELHQSYADGAEVLGDSDLVRLAVSNLLDNALKFTPPGGRVELATYMQRGEVCLAVTNSAPALEHGDLEGIFKPFHRLKGAGGSGYGLGLALVDKAVRSMGGTVRAENVSQGLSIRIGLKAASASG